MHRKLLQAFGVLALTGATALAGSYTSDFSDVYQPGYNLTGSAYMDGTQLILTENVPSQTGTYILDDLDEYNPIESFIVQFKLQMGPGTSPPADGAAFCFGPDINAGSNFAEEGAGSGIIVTFDTYVNADMGETSPHIEVKYGGASVALAPFTIPQMVTSQYEDVRIELKRNGTLSVTYKGSPVFTDVVLPGFFPTQGQFAIGARAGGLSAQHSVDDLSVTTVLQGAEIAPTITTHPQSQTVAELANVTFTVAADGSAPLTYQWYKNNTPIADATAPTLTLTGVLFTDNAAKFKCEVSNGAGTATSNEATLTVLQDSTAPTLVSAAASSDFVSVTVTFSEPVAEASGGNKDNYTIAGLTVNSATVNGSKVVLSTSKMTEAGSYTLVVNNVKDNSAAGNTIAANSQAAFRAYAFFVGTVMHKKYDGFPDNLGGNPQNLYDDPRFPNNPDRTDLMYMWEYPANGNAWDQTADPTRNFFQSLEGYFIPPETGNYVFFTAGADHWWLYLSTDEDPANLYMIAAEPGGWSEPRGWTQIYSGSLESRRSDLSTLNVYPTAPYIYLEEGKRYYMLEVHHFPSWAGASDFSATMIKEGDPDPANGTAPTITGSLVASLVDPTGATLALTGHPADQNLEAGRTATFTVAATATSLYGNIITYQWQRQAPGGATWTDIAGATSPSYTTPVLALSDNGAKYRALCRAPGITTPSNAATLTVFADTVAPTIVSVKGSPEFDTVTIKFSEAVDETTAGNKANYTIAGLTINTATVSGDTVVLETSTQPEAATYTLVVNNVKDKSLAGNTIAPNTQATLKTFVFVSGYVVHKKYEGFPNALGNDPVNLYNDPRYPDNPDRVDLMPAFEYPINGGGWDQVLDPNRNFYSTLEAFFIPAQDGNYVFYTAGCGPLVAVSEHG
ncbi:MAG TPA: immunoglobulin domain-containing protein [Verrucomicrobiota bacterium]|nr:immunoglobulin domain-containing protein [Verrucomicrobiota bacterium]